MLYILKIFSLNKYKRMFHNRKNYLKSAKMVIRLKIDTTIWRKEAFPCAPVSLELIPLSNDCISFIPKYLG